MFREAELSYWRDSSLQVRNGPEALRFSEGSFRLLNIVRGELRFIQATYMGQYVMFANGSFARKNGRRELERK